MAGYGSLTFCLNSGHLSSSMTQQMPSRVPTKAAVPAKKRIKISVAAAPAKKWAKAVLIG
jgi:hypothetical protein